MKYIDTHCHIYSSQYDSDREEVINRVQEACVGMIVVGTDIETSKKAIALANEHRDMWAAIALHPVEAIESGVATFDYDVYKNLAQESKVVAIGECGLDYFHITTADPVEAETQRELQHDVFRKHIQLASVTGKPLMLHVRNAKNMNSLRVAESAGGLAAASVVLSGFNAYDDALQILIDAKKAGISIRGNVHSFAGTIEHARKFIDLGFYLSFTGVITFAREYEEVIKATPIDRIMSETDAPYLTPIPFRGKRNEPAYVIEVAQTIEKIRRASGVAHEQILESLVENAKRLFGL